MFQVRKELGIADDVKLVIFNFGGQVRENYHPYKYVPCFILISY